MASTRGSPLVSISTSPDTDTDTTFILDDVHGNLTQPELIATSPADQQPAPTDDARAVTILQKRCPP